MKTVYFKNQDAFNYAVSENNAKLTTVLTGLGESPAARTSDSLLILSECDYNEAPNFERGE
jgi:hypothetical protein